MNLLCPVIITQSLWFTLAFALGSCSFWKHTFLVSWSTPNTSPQSSSSLRTERMPRPRPLFSQGAGRHLRLWP